MLVYITISLRFFKRRWEDFTPLRKRLILGTICSSFCIIVRGVIRTVELSEGWKGYVFTHETFTIFLDGLPILLSMFIFNAVHPGYTLDGDEPKTISPGDRGGTLYGSHREKRSEHYNPDSRLTGHINPTLLVMPLFSHKGEDSMT